MKITGTQIGAVVGAQVKKVTKLPPTTSAESPRAADRIVLSADVSAIETAKKIIADTPDVRSEKVEELRRQIADGSYAVPSDQIAERMLTEGRLGKLGSR